MVESKKTCEMAIQFLEPVRSFRAINSPFRSNSEYISRLTPAEFKNSLHGYYLTFGFVELLSKYLEFDAISTIFDIGARYGETSIEFSFLFPRASIYAFDPHPWMASIFEKLKEDSPSRTKNIHWTTAALDKSSSQKAFHMTADDPGTYSLLEANPNHPIAQSWGKFESRIKSDPGNPVLQSLARFKNSIQAYDQAGNPALLPLVPTIRLDAFCREKSISSVDILWIDVQGFEENVLIGCGSLLNSVKAIHVETSLQPLGQGIYLNSANFKVVNNLLASKGFRLISVISDDLSVEGDLVYLNKGLFKD